MAQPLVQYSIEVEQGERLGPGNRLVYLLIKNQNKLADSNTFKRSPGERREFLFV